MYTQFYTKTVYSLMKSSVQIEDYVYLAKQYQMKYLGITDLQTVYGLIKFYKACKKENIKPILGLTVYIEKDSPLILLAKSNLGFKNLLRISTEIQLNQFKLLDLNELKINADDLICIVPMNDNHYESLLSNDNIDLLSGLLNKLKSIFKNNLYISVLPEFNDKYRIFNKKIQFISNQITVPLVAVHEVSYLNKEDFLTKRYLEAISLGEKITSRINLINDHNYFLKPESFQELFQNHPQAIINTLRISEMCQVDIDFNKLHLPKYKTVTTSDEYLKQLCKKGLEKRLQTSNIPHVYLNRLKYELRVIKEMNYSDYFLIVYDFVKYAKMNNILVGPGRGSAAGSLVSYVLGITNIDPIQYNLLFERFLNPERVSMPDIDLDFQDDRRDEVIKYVQKKYGKYNVGHIISFGTFLSRSALREVAKVLDIKPSRLNEIISHINSQLTIEENIKNNDTIKKMIEEYQEINQLFVIAKKIEGIPRNTSTHAAGIIICEEDLRELSGLQPSLDDILQTQFEAKDLEELGLLKIDFLGLRNLTAISQVIDLVKKTHGIEVDINHLPLDDAKTFRLISRGETTGIFQLESSGMRNVLYEMKASSFEDIVATNALFRPGPMENISTYIKRKLKQDKIDYLHDDLRSILQSTYGIIVYQEQVMLVAQAFANYSLAQADLLRRAMSKKQKSVLEEERVKFVQGAIEKGYDQNTAEKLYDYILKFGDYGFNRSHSVAYALISYQMAYLKANYLVPFMVVLLSNVLGNDSQTRRYIMDCKRYGIKILPISINKSYNNYLIEENNNIRMSFLTIKGIGKNISEALLNERNKGDFINFFDFVYRTNGFIKQNVYSSLVFVGAFDEFGFTKKALIDNYDKVYDLCRFNPSGYFTNQIELEFNSEEYPTSELMKKEKEYLGFYLTTHPLQKIQLQNEILPSQTLKYMDQTIEVVGYLESMKIMMTKKGEEMASIVVSDDIVSINGVIFPSNYVKLKSMLETDHIYSFGCKVQERNQKVQLIINKLKIIK